MEIIESEIIHHSYRRILGLFNCHEPLSLSGKIVI